MSDLLGRGKPECLAAVDGPIAYRNGHGKPRRLTLLDDATASRLRSGAVIGTANDQSAGAGVHADALHAHGFLYAPDYDVNAGGLISLLARRGGPTRPAPWPGWTASFPRVTALLERAPRERVAFHRLADRLAEERQAAAPRERPRHGWLRRVGRPAGSRVAASPPS